jgi:spermidine synthase
VTNLAYAIPNLKTGAVIGVGGGRDVLSQRLFGVSDVTGVEINPIIVDVLKHHFSDYTAIAVLDGVKFEVDEARSWFARTPRAFDVIQMSLIDTWAATGAGAFTRSAQSGRPIHEKALPCLDRVKAVLHEPR